MVASGVGAAVGIGRLFRAGHSVRPAFCLFFCLCVLATTRFRFCFAFRRSVST